MGKSYFKRFYPKQPWAEMGKKSFIVYANQRNKILRLIQVSFWDNILKFIIKII